MNERELRSAFAELPSPCDSSTAWGEYQVVLRREIAQGDLSRFLNWAIIKKTMFVANARYIRDEFNVLHERAPWMLDVLNETSIGKPARLPWAPWTSGNMVHQGYHLWQWMKMVKRSDLNDLGVIAEVGAGYGVMALLCRRLGFRGDYIIDDLAEYGLLQRFYLARQDMTNIQWTNVESYHPDLFIALFSLSEIPVNHRHVCEASNYLIGYKPHYGNIDNAAFFDDIRVNNPTVEWHDYINEWHSSHGKNWRYSIGYTK